jgi:hypothetical protein
MKMIRELGDITKLYRPGVIGVTLRTNDAATDKHTPLWLQFFTRF